MLKSEAAAYLAGVTQTEGAEASAPTNLHVITGEVGEASADGKTLVKIDGLMFSESDDQFIEVDALGGLEEGDIATIVLTGEQGHAMTPLALGSIGSVDRITVRIAAIEADYIKVEQLDAAEARIGELEADHVSVDDLDAATARIGTLETTRATITDLEAATARIGDLEADHVSTDDLNAATARIGTLEADHVSTDDLNAAKARIGTLETNTADIGTIRANSAKVQNLTAAELEADHATVGSLSTTYATIANLNAANGRITNLESTKANISDLEADYITADEIEATYMHANMSNSDVAWIQNGTIKDGAIVSAMINDVSANKLTAGTINGSVINVTNLNADNITTGTINGQRIGEGSLSLSKLEDDVYTESEVDAKLATMQAEIDGAIETWTGTSVPTLNNSPASNWTTAAVRDTHVGDVYFVVNSQSQQNGYNYRFTKSGSTYSWQLIKDSDVTNALQRLETAEGKITTFDSDVSTLKTDTGSLTTRTTNLETRMSDAENDILDKVDTTTFNEVSDTVDQHSQTISQHTTAISNKADSSTVTAVTNRVSKNEQDISGINTTIGELQDTVEAKADGSTVTTISNKLNTVSDTVDGHTQTLTSVQNTLSTKADSSTVSTLTMKVNNVSDTVDGHTSQLSSITTTQTTMQTALDKTVKSSIQLWYSKANTTAPSKPTSKVTSTSTSGNAWRIVVPAYNASYPHYFYCWQYEYVDGTYGWSAVVRDIAMGESQSTARTADSNASAAVTTANTASTNASTALTTANTANTNASDAKTAATAASTTASEAKTTAETAASDASTAKTNAASAVSTANSASTTATNAQNTANANIKSSVQLWFTKANSTAPSKPTSVVSTSNANTANAWNLVVPVWNKNYPHYFYCYQQQKGDGNYQWTDVVYDRATSEAQQLANTTSTSLTTLQEDYATYKQTTTANVSSIGTRLTTAEGKISTAETAIEQNSEAIALRATKTEVYQNAHPNLSPFFSHTLSDVYSTDNPDGYWHNSISTSYITELNDGWAHIKVSNTGTNNVFANYFVAKSAIPESFKPSTKYMFLVETRNVTKSGTITVFATNNFTTQIHAFTANASFTLSGDENKYLSATSVSDWSSAALFTRGYVQVPGSASVEMDIRISLYEGEYSGPYKPYVDQTLSNRVKSAETSIEQNSEAIALRATKADVQSLGGNLLTDTDNPVLGSNIAPKYSVVSGGNGTGTIATVTDSPLPNFNKAFRITGNTSGNRDFAQSVGVVYGQKYLFTAYARGIGGNATALIRVFSGSELFTYTTVVGTDWTPIRTIVTLTGGGSAAYYFFQFGLTGAGSIEYIAPCLSGGAAANTAAELKVANDNINLKVSKNDVINQINVSTEGAKIQASKVEIDGTAVFSAISSDVDDAITSKGYATTTQAQGYATTAKSEAISAAATDATTKANAAETNAKNDTTSRLNAMGSDNKVVNGAFVNGTDNWSTWGTPTTRNRVQVNGKWWMHCVTTATQYQGYNQNHYTSLGVTVEPSTTYTVGITARGAAANTKVCVGFHWFAPSGTSIVSQSWLTFTVGTTAARQYQTVTVPSGIDHFNVMVGQNTATAQEFWITDVTLVKGTVNQEWSESSALAGQASITANAAAPKANAVKRTQRIWYRKSASGAPSTPGTASSNWVTKADDGNDKWTKMHISISGTHKYIYTCEQYEMANGTVGYTSVLLDNTITVIDGGNIITGSVTANKLNAANINASKSLTVGAMTDAAASTILNSNVQVGGRNLLLNTGISQSKRMPAVAAGSYTTWDPYTMIGAYSTLGLTTSDSITVSFDWSVAGAAAGSTVKIGTNASPWEYFGVLITFAAGASSGHVEKTFAVTSTLASATGTTLRARIDAVRNAITTSMVLTISNAKLEKGNKATDWTPAPEDQTAYVDAIQVGGRNLLYHSLIGYAGNANNWVRTDEVWQGTAGAGWGLKFPSSMFVVGESYVLSFYYQKVSGTLRGIGGHHSAFDNPKFIIDGVVQPSTFHAGRAMNDDALAHYIVVCLTYNGGQTDNNLYIQPNRGAYSSSNDSVFKIWNIKIEIGNKATDWTPAPEDMATAESLAGTNESLEGAITDIGELSDQLVDTTTEQNKTITDIQKYLNSLRQDLDAEIQSRQQWLNFNAAEGLIIGAAGSTFKTVTTNTSQQFRSGGTVLAETSGSEFVAPVMRSDQILIGNWMWTRRDNGNLSLKWIG